MKNHLIVVLHLSQASLWSSTNNGSVSQSEVKRLWEQISLHTIWDLFPLVICIHSFSLTQGDFKFECTCALLASFRWQETQRFYSSNTRCKTVTFKQIHGNANELAPKTWQNLLPSIWCQLASWASTLWSLLADWFVKCQIIHRAKGNIFRCCFCQSNPKYEIEHEIKQIKCKRQSELNTEIQSVHY